MAQRHLPRRPISAYYAQAILDCAQVQGIPPGEIASAIGVASDRLAKRARQHRGIKKRHIRRATQYLEMSESALRGWAYALRLGALYY
ncbi:MAG: hypothetical protein WEA04_03255 [Candidatus Andersenbacteria bacterium]